VECGCQVVVVMHLGQLLEVMGRHHQALSSSWELAAACCCCVLAAALEVHGQLGGSARKRMRAEAPEASFPPMGRESGSPWD